MEYQLLDDLLDESNARLEPYCERNGIYVKSYIEEVTEPFNGSSDNIRLYIFKNYMSRTGLIDLAIIFRETERNLSTECTDETSDIIEVTADVESSIFPLYLAKPTAFDIPTAETAPDLHPDEVKFILERRQRPRVNHRKGEVFDPNKHQWNVNLLAEALHISNRIVSQYVRAKNI